MSLPFTLPTWLPWWVPILLLVPAILYGLAVLLMPFSVLGVKGRLETIEDRLDEIQGEIRSLVLRMPEPARALDFEDVYGHAPGQPRPGRPMAEERPIPARPPIPPAAHELDDVAIPPRRGFGRMRQDPEPPAPARSEPRFDRPRR
ncbi:MAG: hypothetical protein JSR21_06520 [Proteobacteria bacterium]|nr:hypothetical protein [Pseudomonadota bacterium]